MHLSQPHKHHEGEITLKVVSDLRDKCLDCWKDITNGPDEVSGAELISAEDVIDLAQCLAEWTQTFHYACIRLDRVCNKIEAGLGTNDDDRKVVDICLSILDDYATAKTKLFLNQ